MLTLSMLTNSSDFSFGSTSHSFQSISSATDLIQHVCLTGINQAGLMQPLNIRRGSDVQCIISAICQLFFTPSIHLHAHWPGCLPVFPHDIIPHYFGSHYQLLLISCNHEESVMSLLLSNQQPTSFSGQSF